MDKYIADQFVDLMEAPYSRRGSFLAFANNKNGENLYGKCTLWLCNCRIGMGAMSVDMFADNRFRQVRLELVKDGNVVPALITTTPYEVILSSRYGSMRFCIGERRLVMCRGGDGLALRVTPLASYMMGAGITDLMGESGAQMIGFGATRLLVMPIVGKLAVTGAFVELQPDASGTVQLCLEEYLIDPVHRAASEYPSYDQCVANVKADFDGFCQSVFPSLPATYEPQRLQAIWQTWNMIVDPDGESDYTRPMVKMIHSIFEAAFVWQQPMQAVWLSNNLQLAWEIFVSGFDFLDANGRMVDALSHRLSFGGEGLKPPVHGMMLLWLMQNTDFASIAKDSKEYVWDGLVRWTEYFFKFRDKDHDGVAEFQALLETGWEDAPYYSIGFPCASPDLNAYLALSLEALAVLGRDIGKPEDVCAGWERRSKELITKIIEKFWDGERWYAFNAKTGERSGSTSIALYTALVLGKRLPQEIIDKSIAYIFSPDGFATEHGLASEGLTSDYFTHSFTRGSIIVPAVFLMVQALEECGRGDLAKTAAQNYCNTMRDNGFYHIHNALTGRGDRSLTAFGEPGLFWSAWASSCYLFMAEKYGA